MTAQEGQPAGRIALRSDRDVARARRAVARAMEDLGARAIRRTRFVTAVSEIARNAVVHGGGGEMTVFVHGDPPGVSICCQDNGPGIENIKLAMSDGFTTAGGLGQGLGGARRLADSFEIETAPGAGTTIRMAAQL